MSLARRINTETYQLEYVFARDLFVLGSPASPRKLGKQKSLPLGKYVSVRPEFSERVFLMHPQKIPPMIVVRRYRTRARARLPRVSRARARAPCRCRLLQR